MGGNGIMKRFFAIVLAAAMVMGLLTGCSSSAGAAKKEKLTIWINGSDSYISPQENEMAQDKWYITQAIKRFEEANPGVEIELVVQADGETAHQAFKADSLAGTAPDIGNFWTGQNIYAMEDVILDITKYIPAEDKANIVGWDSVTSPATGAILGYPTADNQVCYFLYNRAIINECGLDFDNNPPKTTEEFDAAMQVIKDHGYQPLASDEGFPWFGCYIGNYWWVSESGYPGIISDCEGKTKFAEDPGFINAFNYYKSTLDNGFLNADCLTCADSFNKFCQGKVAMMPQESSVVGDAEAALGAENIGLLLPPDIPTAKTTGGTIGGPGQCFVVSKSCKNPELAVKFISFMDSKEEMLNFLKVQAKVPTRTDITAADLGYAEGSNSAKLVEMAAKTIYWVDNSLYPSVSGDFYDLLPSVLAGKMTVEEFGALLDADVAAAK